MHWYLILFLDYFRIRHRAAVGVSDEAMQFVSSYLKTGAMSIAHELEYNVAPDQLYKAIVGT